MSPVSSRRARVLAFALACSACSSTRQLGELFDECLARESQGWLYCNGFEDGLGAWDDRDTNPQLTNALVQDDGPLALEDNTVMRMGFAGGALADLVKRIDPTLPRVHVRLYARWEAGFDFERASLNLGLFDSAASLGSKDIVGAWITDLPRSGTTPTFGVDAHYPDNPDCPDPAASGCTPARFLPLGTAQPDLRTDQWYCLELMLEPGPQGTLDLWVAGLARGSRGPLPL